MNSEPRLPERIVVIHATEQALQTPFKLEVAQQAIERRQRMRAQTDAQIRKYGGRAFAWARSAEVSPNSIRFDGRTIDEMPKPAE